MQAQVDLTCPRKIDTLVKAIWVQSHFPLAPLLFKSNLTWGFSPDTRFRLAHNCVGFRICFQAQEFKIASSMFTGAGLVQGRVFSTHPSGCWNPWSACCRACFSGTFSHPPCRSRS